jgi:hypothetical protein
VWDWLHAHRELVEMLTFRYYAVILAASLLTLVTNLGGVWTRGWPLLVLWVLWTLFYVMFLGVDRFHLPLAPVMATFAAVGGTALGSRALRWVRAGRGNQAVRFPSAPSNQD